MQPFLDKVSANWAGFGEKSEIMNNSIQIISGKAGYFPIFRDGENVVGGQEHCYTFDPSWPQHSNCQLGAKKLDIEKTKHEVK